MNHDWARYSRWRYFARDLQKLDNEGGKLAKYSVFISSI